MQELPRDDRLSFKNKARRTPEQRHEREPGSRLSGRRRSRDPSYDREGTYSSPCPKDPRNIRRSLMRLVLLDVDMTLISARGAGIASLDGAVHELFGLERAFEGVEFAGCTDRMIVESGLTANGIEATGENLSRVRSAYIRRLSKTLSEGWPAHALAGVPALLELLSERNDACYGLVTGNWKEGAFLKLAACGIDGYFRFGAFAESGRTRSELIPHALGRAGRFCGGTFDPDEVWVVGDTPHDVSCGKAWGLRTMAVATGPYGTGDLEATGADAVMQDLSDTDLVMEILLGRRGRP